VQRGAGRLRAAEYAYVGRADLLRDVQPFTELGQLLFPLFGRGLRETYARSDAVDLDAVLVSETTQRQQVVVGRAGQPVHRHVDAGRTRLDGDAYQILIRHRLCLERLSVRVGDQARTKAGGPRLRSRGLSWKRLPGIGHRGGNDGRSGSSQKAPAIHRQLSS